MMSLKDVVLDERGMLVISDKYLLGQISGAAEAAPFLKSTNIGACGNNSQCCDALNLGVCIP